MERAHLKMSSFMPLDGERFLALDEDQIGHIDQYIYRFSKLQDTLGDKLYKSLLLASGETVKDKTFIDLFHRLEELDVTENYEQWSEFRIIRNEISHDYDMTDAEIAQKLNLVYGCKEGLKSYFERVEKFVLERGLIHETLD